MTINTKCVDSIKNKQGRITHYILENTKGDKLTFEVEELKRKMKSRYIYAENLLIDKNGNLRVTKYRQFKRVNHWNKYYIMHGSRKIASIGKNGVCKIYSYKFLPYNLYLEETNDDIDTLVNNLTNFNFWCASRVLTLDREYAKEILNSIGASQASTDKDRAQIALTYHCLSLSDIYWVRESYEHVSFDAINLYQNNLHSAFVDVSLRGKQMTINNSHLIADDLATNGCFPKAWIREGTEFFLMKDGGEEPVKNELLASKICQCFSCNQVAYERYIYDEQEVTRSKIITSLDYSIVSYENFNIYAINHNIDIEDFIIKLDAYSFHMMNILDYLIGNTDRHWGNWGVLVNNKTNRPIRLYDLMDFNKSFGSYDLIEGANCLTTSKKTQMEAAIDGVKSVGLNQVKQIQKTWFGNPALYEMFKKRLNILKNV